MELTGIHHLTAISAAIRENHRFYTGTLGMRLVKRTVNQDDVGAYHLFYADAKGQSRHRSHVLRLARSARAAWHTQHRPDLPARERERGADVVGASLRRAGRASRRDRRARWSPTLLFEDPEGQRLALVDDGGLGDPPTAWDRSPVPREWQIRGLGPIVISVPTLNPTDGLLTRVFNMRQARDCPHPDNPAHPRARVRDGRRRTACGAARRRAARSPGRPAGCGWRAPCRVPYAGRQLRRVGRTAERVPDSQQRQGRSVLVPQPRTYASRTGCSSRSRPTVRGSPSTRIPRRSARGSCCRRFSSRRREQILAKLEPID